MTHTSPKTLLLIALSISLFSTACGYSVHVERGDNLAAKGQWDDALQAYEDALAEDPEDHTAVARAEKARKRLALQLCDKAEGKIAQNQWKSAHTLLNRAASLDRNATCPATLQQHSLNTLLDESKRLSNNAQFEDSWKLSILARNLYPNSPKVDPLVESLRSSLLDLCSSHIDAQRFEDADRTLQLLERLDPAVQHRTAPMRTRINTTWALSLRTRAQEHATRNERAHAAILYSHAYDLASNTSDRQHRDDLLETLRSEGLFTVALTAKGDRKRALAMQNALQTSFDTSSPIRFTRTPHTSKLALSLHVDRASCDESSIQEHASHRYVSGTKQVSNPAYTNLQDQLHTAQDQLTKHRTRHASLSSTNKSLQTEIRTLTQRTIPPLERRLNSATEALQRIAREERESRSKLTTLQDQLQRAQSASQQRVDLQNRLDSLQRTHTSNINALREAQREVDSLQPQFDEAQNAIIPLDNKLARLRAKLRDAQNALRKHTRSHQQLIDEATRCNTQRTRLQNDYTTALRRAKERQNQLRANYERALRDFKTHTQRQQQRHNELTSQRDSLQNKLRNIQNQRDSLARTVDQLQRQNSSSSQLQSLQNQLRDQQQRAQSIQNKLQRIQSTLNNPDNNPKTIQQRLETLQNEQRNTIENYKKLKQTYSELQRQNPRPERKLQSIQRKLQTYSDTLRNNRDQQRELQDLSQNLDAQLDTLKDKRTRLQNALRTAHNNISTLQTQLQSLQRSSAQHTNALRTAQQRLSDANTTLRSLQSKLQRTERLLRDNQRPPQRPSKPPTVSLPSPPNLPSCPTPPPNNNPRTRDLEERVQRLRAEVQTAQNDLERANTAAASIRSKTNRAKRRLSTAQSQHSTTQSKLQRLQSQLSSLQDSTRNLPSTSTLSSRIEAQQRTQTRLRDELQRTQSQHSTTQNELRTAQSQLSSLQRNLSNNDSQRSAAHSQAQTTQNLIDRLRSGLRDTPRTITKNVYSTFHYDIQTSTLTCTSTATLSSLSSEPFGTPSRDLSKSLSTKDSHHRAHTHRLYRIDENPLQYPTPKPQLIQNTDQHLSKLLTDDLQTRFQTYHTSLLQRARDLETSNPQRAAELYLTAYLLNPSSKPSHMLTHLKDFNLPKVALLTKP